MPERNILVDGADPAMDPIENMPDGHERSHVGTIAQ